MLFNWSAIEIVFAILIGLCVVAALFAFFASLRH
jgi:hypothetical protein